MMFTLDCNHRDIFTLDDCITPTCLVFQVAIIVLYIRRHPSVSGGELGGPKGLKIISSAFFLILWIIFVALSAMEAYQIIDPNF